MKLSPQCRKVYDYMKRNGSITTLDAFLDLGVTRLSGRIHDLRNDGVSISSDFVQVSTRAGTATVARYSLL